MITPTISSWGSLNLYFVYIKEEKYFTFRSIDRIKSTPFVIKLDVLFSFVFDHEMFSNKVGIEGILSFHNTKFLSVFIFFWSIFML